MSNLSNLSKPSWAKAQLGLDKLDKCLTHNQSLGIRQISKCKTEEYCNSNHFSQEQSRTKTPRVAQSNKAPIKKNVNVKFIFIFGSQFSQTLPNAGRKKEKNGQKSGVFLIKKLQNFSQEQSRTKTPRVHIQAHKQQ